MANKVWFITGSSKGFGKVWAEAALARGDSVAATARDPRTLSDLVEKYGDRVAALKLDVTDKAEVTAAVAEAHKKFGRLDVVINNAGYGQFGAIEEISEEEARAQMETNVFGALWVTQAALPIMRAQKSGHIIQISSIGGVNAFPNIGLYHASKWALEGFSQALSLEVADMGIHVTLVEPSGFATDWSGPSAKRATPNPVYESARARMAERRGNVVPGDPEATGTAMLALVDAAEPPLRVFFGDVGLPMIKQEYASRLALWEKWDFIADMAQGEKKNRKA
ncbi:SDR family oxidoreductase [Mesorhizobium sp. ASY16-5R]|uniref:SDR family oxidoreductase n=1 Tax=Mesorhizobium sp. ASY16-5R TaxID=3445772 RepID=UPI003F9F8061